MPNTVTIRIPPVELELFGARVQLKAKGLHAPREYVLSDREVRMLRTALDMFNSIGRQGKVDNGSPLTSWSVT